MLSGTAVRKPQRNPYGFNTRVLAHRIPGSSAGGNFRPANIFSEDPSAPSSDLTELKTNKPDIKQKDTLSSRGNDQPPSGTNPPGGTGTDNKIDLNNSSNTKATVGLFLTTMFFGGCSLMAHFTDFLEGTTKNLLAFLADGVTAFTAALTLSSILSPTVKDGYNTNHHIN